MNRKIELLDKKKHTQLQFDEITASEVAILQRLIPLGFNEVIEMAPFAPIIIKEEQGKYDFVAFTGSDLGYDLFATDSSYVPLYCKAYPFVSVSLVDHLGDQKECVGIDHDQCVGDRTYKIFEDGQTNGYSSKKIRMVQDLNFQRAISRKIIQDLKKYDLLIQRDFKVTYEEKTKVILDNFYIVDRSKLIEFEDQTVALWAKKGWITLFDLHLKSITNFKKFFVKI